MPMAIILCRACWLDMCRGSRDRCGRCPVIAMQRLDAFDFRKALELERLDDDVQPESPFQGMGRSLGVGLGLAVALLCALASKAQQFANLLPRLSSQTQHSHYRARSLSTLLTNLLQICDHSCEVILASWPGRLLLIAAVRRDTSWVDTAAASRPISGLSGSIVQPFKTRSCLSTKR